MDELVKRLREVADEVDSDYDVDPYNAEQRCLAILQAADAIEALSKLALDEHNRAAVAAWEHRWIPVSERLMHSGWYLVACNEWGGSAVRKAIYDEATRKWLEFPCGGPKDITKFVTRYMPLPEPPKEEKDKND